MPFVDKNRYKIFAFGKIYIIKNEECIKELKKLEEFREFIWSYKPPIIIPIIILSLIAGFLISLFLNNFNYINMIVADLSIIIYILISIGYYLKIKKAINCKKKCDKNGNRLRD